MRGQPAVRVGDRCGRAEGVRVGVSTFAKMVL